MKDTTAKEIPDITAENAGTWLDGCHGWTNGYRAVERAIAYGWTVPEEYAEGWKKFTDAPEYGDRELWYDANGDDGGFVDAATDYLQSIAPEGYVLRWDDGLSMLPDWADCAADGNGCQVTGYDDKGNEIVKPCRDHNPCEGHSGEDDQLTSGAGIGETAYCDGSCMRR